MTPIKQGLYEFRRDSLIDLRNSLGINQGKMAELLNVPANTLSRWETGATVPDAESLAAFYSLAQDHGSISPSFFGVRSQSLEVKMSSKTSDMPEDSLGFYHLLRSYLNAQIELIGAEPTQVIRVKIQNTAIPFPEWPKVVFMGVGLSLAHAGGDTQAFRPSKLKIKISRESEQEVQKTATTPWEHDPKRERLAKIEFHRLDSKEFPDTTGEESAHGEMLFPGQSVIYEIDVTPDLLPYLQFRVEGNLSRRYLFRCEETFTMPLIVTKPLVLSALADFNTIDIHEPLEYVISSMPKLDGDTPLREIQAFSGIISSGTTKIEAAQKELQAVFRRHKFSLVQAHGRATFIYLDQVKAALIRMKDAILSNIPDNIAAEASIILALRTDAAQLNRETQELMSNYNISEDETNYRYKG